MSDLPINTRITSTARDLLNSRGRFLESVRALSALRFEISADGHDPDFLLFLAIDSQTDHLPSATARAHSSPKWLAKCDEEESRLACFYENDVNNACRKLIRRFDA